MGLDQTCRQEKPDIVTVKPNTQTSVLALDVGGTDIKAAVVRHDGSFVLRREFPTWRHRGPEQVVSTMVEILQELRDDAFALGVEPVAIGVAIPGRVDEDSGIGVSAANMRWDNTPVREPISEQLRLPTVLRHDIRSGALAESRLGAGRHYPNFIFVAIGTGIAAGIVIDHRVWRGERSVAGELGHTVVRAGGPECFCGQRGCLETVASAAAIARMYLHRSGQSLDGAREVLAAAQGGDTIAISVWNEALNALADGIVMTSSILDITTYVIGGGLSLAGDDLFKPLQQIIDTDRTDRVQPRVVPAQLGTEAGCLGAALAAIDIYETVRREV